MRDFESILKINHYNFYNKIVTCNENKQIVHKIEIMPKLGVFTKNLFWNTGKTGTWSKFQLERF